MCESFGMCECVCFLKCVGVCMRGFVNMWLCVCVGFVICGCVCVF